MKKRLLISFSGGRTSAMMTKWLLDNKRHEYDMIVVFANTGHEREATLQFVNDCDTHFNFGTVWVEGVFGESESGVKVVDFQSAYRNVRKNGIDPFEAMIAKNGYIPNQMVPSCTRDLKQQTVRKYARSIGWEAGTYETAIGIRSDEPRRINWEKAKAQHLVYFAQFGRVTRKMVNEYWAKQPFDLRLKSYEGNCMLCFKKSNRKLLTLISEGLRDQDPELLAEMAWLQSIHDKYGSDRQPMFRGERDMADLLEDAEGFSNFVSDENSVTVTAKQLSLWNEDLDMESECSESCEVH
jgi:hypothetical protein